MGTARPPHNFLLLLLFFTSLIAISSTQGSANQVVLPPLHHHLSTIESSPTLKLGKLGTKEVTWEEMKKRYVRRLLIGSTAPICTYNECRGCKFKCRAEQIPVDANDPINSAYHYRCVCHR